MKRAWVWATLAGCLGGWGLIWWVLAWGDPPTHTLPDDGRQRQQLHGDLLHTGYVVSGCLPSVPGGGGLTLGSFACEAYVKDTTTGELVYTREPGATLGPVSGTSPSYVLVRADTSTVPASWTCKTGSRYCHRQSGTLPTTPTKTAIIAKLTITAGSITAVDDLRLPASYARFGVYDVTDPLYGAIPDDSVDDQAAFASALAAMPSAGIGGGTLVVPIGTYDFASGLSLKDRRNLTIRCATVVRRAADQQACTLKYTAAGGSLLTFLGATGITIEGFNLAYSHAAYASTFLDLDQGSGAVNTSEILLRHNRIGGLSTSSKAATSLVHVGDLVYDVTFDGNVFQNGAIYVLGSTTSVINSNSIKLRDNLFLQGATTVQVQAGGQAWSLTGNTFEPRTVGGVAGAFDTTSVGVRGLLYHGNWHGDASSGTWFQVTGGALSGASIHGNEMQSTGGDCVSLGASIATSIMGNMLECGSGVSIVLGTSQGTIALGNRKTNTMLSGLATLSTRSLVDDGSRMFLTGLGLDFDRAEFGQSAAWIRARNPASGNSVEWGHSNNAGYVNMLGNETSSGKGFICLSCEAGTNANTYLTRGLVGRILQNDKVGGLVLGRAATATADNQALTTDVTITTTGQVKVEALKTTGSAGGKAVVCVDTATGQLYASSTGVDCSN